MPDSPKVLRAAWQNRRLRVGWCRGETRLAGTSLIATMHRLGLSTDPAMQEAAAG
jgi:hypothetical protein